MIFSFPCGQNNLSGVLTVVIVIVIVAEADLDLVASTATLLDYLIITNIHHLPHTGSSRIASAHYPLD
jgi:hypothetical protein